MIKLRYSIREYLERPVRRYRGLNARNRFLVMAGLLVVALIILPSALVQLNFLGRNAADLYFVGPSAGQVVGQNFPVELHVKTHGKPINAVGAVITYNTNYLEVASMTTEKSPCSFYLDNSFDNIEGKVHISCGLPDPGFLGDSPVVHLTMRAKIPGTSALTLDESEAFVLANDSAGTNILSEIPRLNLAITRLL